MRIQYRTFWKSSGIWIDPGQCFGTRNHLSTAIESEMLEQYLLDADTFPESMIDLGIGQGILAIVAYRLSVPKGQVWILKLKRSLN